MAAVPPGSFPPFNPVDWDKFGRGVQRQVELALKRLAAGAPLPSTITSGGALAVGKQAQYRALVAGLARTYRIPTGYAQVAAWASVANADAAGRSLQWVIDNTPAQVQAAAAGLNSGLPAGAYFNLATPNPATAVAIATVTQGRIVADATRLAAEVPGLITDIVRAGVITGDSMRNVATQIIQQTGDALYQTSAKQLRARAEMIARTQTADAYNLVSRASYLTSSVVTHWEWLAYTDERTCAICLALDGQVFRQEVEPDPHHNCRCTMIPIDGPPTVTSNGYNANGRRVVNGQDVPLDWQANQELARAQLPKSWNLDGTPGMPPVDLTRLVGWNDNPNWRPSAVIVKPGKLPDVTLGGKKRL